METTVKKNVEEDKEDNKEGNSRDFLHESLGITYRLVEKDKQDLECDLDALNDIFVSVNFSRRPNDKLYLALEKSYLCCFAEVDVEYETRALDVNNNSVESTSVETRREVIGFRENDQRRRVCRDGLGFSCRTAVPRERDWDRYRQRG